MKVKTRNKLSVWLLFFPLIFAFNVEENNDIREKLAAEIEASIQTQLINKWYPLAIDSVHGGFLSNFTYEFVPEEKQEKMIVSQARHLWTTSKASIYYSEDAPYESYAEHGFPFLRDKFWDKKYGGFHTLLDQQGNVLSSGQEHKTAYGNAFAIFGLAAYVEATADTAALDLAKKAFLWLEKHSHDPVHLGYFQSLDRDGTPLLDRAGLPSTSQIGYKDQNSSIHLLEAFTELYAVWPEELLRERLEEMLFLIRDTLIMDKGYLQLFFYPDWKPVSYRDSSRTQIEKHHSLDHVSFGHDVETAYLMLEASHVLGIKDDPVTMTIAKKMVDHALINGWDSSVGGFYDGGYYFKGEDNITIVKDSKNWWAQAEGLNTLLIMADYFPDDEMDYFGKFQKQWDYVQTYIIDQEHGEWYAGGLDKEPQHKQTRKGHIWKTPYHNFRALANCVQRLRSKDIPL
jgi:mannobiose 2-epimerase